MKNLKRLMSVVLSVVMLLSFAVSTSAATFADVEETSNAYEAIEVLAALKILEGKEAGNFDPEANIKRSEFAAVLCRAMNQDSAALGSASFSDVTPDHWAYNYIGWAAASEIVNGRGDGTFDPDANVSYNEAIAMIVRALGYEWYVNEFLGGYPSGHGRIASSYKIDKGVGVANGNLAATRADVALLLYNAFDAPLMDVRYISYEPSYAIYDGSKAVDYEKRTLLSYYSDIYKIRATVDTTYRNDSSLIASNGDKKMDLTVKSLYGFEELDVEDALNLSINNTTGAFTAIANNEDWASFQGYVVNAYVTVNAKEKAEIVAMVADNTSVEELVIDNAAELIVDSTIAGDDVNLEYYETVDASKAKTVKVAAASETALYVNSMLIGTLDDATAAAEFESLDDGYYSSVTLLGSDGIYNKIYVVSYEYGIVEDVDTELEVIETDANSYYLSADNTSDEFVYNIYKDGAKIELADLAEGDLLNIVIGDATLSGDVANATFVDIYVTNNVIESTVKYVDNGAYNIDGKDYYTIGGVTLKPGDTGSFYITIDGYIYDAEFTSTYSDNYAFILDVASSNTGFGETWQIKLLDKNNNVKVLNVKSSVYITDETYSKASFKTDASAANKQSVYFNALDAKLSASAADADAAINALKADIPARLVTFKEADGYVTELVFAKSGSQDRDFDYVSLNGTYGEKTGLLAGRELLDATVLFNVPVKANAVVEVEAGVWTLDADMIQVYAAASLKDKAAYTGYAYNVDEDNNTFGAAILTNDMGFSGNINALAVIMSISDGLDANNEPASLVKFFQGGEIKTLVVATTAYAGDDITAAGAGDIFQYSVNGAGEINKAYLVYDYVAGGQSELLKANDGDVDYYVGLVSGNTAKVLTFGSEAIAWDLADGCTNVLFDTDLAKKNVSNAVRGYSSTSYIKDYSLNSKTGDFASDAYIAVVRTEDDVIVDVVAYVYDRPAMTDVEFEAAYLK